MKKVYINGWDGPWGYKTDIQNCKLNLDKLLDTTPKFSFVDNPEDADIIWQIDTTNYQAMIKYLGKKYVIANVLDLADWITGEPSIEILEYVLKFAKHANKVTAISQDVINKLVKYDIVAEMYYYPSQVSVTKNNYDKVLKTKMFISFCRLGDPGKRINEAVNAFIESGLPQDGWKYILSGPEQPMEFYNNKSILYVGYLEKDMLFNFIRSAAYVIQPSIGEGLGLPAIEGALLGTPFITRNVEPMATIWKYVSVLLFENSALDVAMLDLANMFNTNTEYYNVLRNKATHIATPWTREYAFQAAFEMLEKI